MWTGSSNHAAADFKKVWPVVVDASFLKSRIREKSKQKGFIRLHRGLRIIIPASLACVMAFLRDALIYSIFFVALEC